ncbi:MAG: DUF1003 domain-containing protein [Capsulimonadales bacterium]|nr:DUF1003 domain-containing protein [Capsulimonadales bacterium]
MNDSNSCPACHRQNDTDAIFCRHCRKALGPFPYIEEEVERETAWYERWAERTAEFIGRPHYFAVHTVWFLGWALLNAGIVAAVGKFDAYPYNLLGLMLGIEAIFVTGFLLIAQNRENTRERRLAELEYEINVRAYREIQEVKSLLNELAARRDQGGTNG